MPTYEGAIESLNSQQLNYISSVLEKHGFGDAKVTVNSVGEAADNFSANVKRFVTQKDGKSCKIIVKVAPTIELMRQISNTHNLFFNEYIMYDQVLRKFTELEIQAGIPKEDRLRYAGFYGAYLEEPHELILLEDLQEPGFALLDRFKSLNDDAVKLVLRSLARLHALSYALKAKEPKTFADFKSKLTNPILATTANETSRLFFGMLEEDTLALVDSNKYKNAVKGTVGKINELMKNLYKFDFDSRYSVIQQGDSWINNIMFRMEGDKPLECCIVDYQVSRINSPVADLHYMMFNCTDYETRSQHYKEWLDFYHTQLGKDLFEFGLKADYWYPREQLDADMKRHGKVSLGFAILLASMITRQTADAAKLKEAMQKRGDVSDVVKHIRLTDLDPETKSLFTAKVKGAIGTLFEMGYL